MAVMGRDDIVVGNSTSKSNQSSAEEPAESAGGPETSNPRQQRMCGAMSQQGDDLHGLTQPQEFVRLVGHRYAKIRPPRAPG
jgi:hypothetical protein